MLNPVAVVLQPSRFLGLWFGFCLGLLAAYGALLASSVDCGACDTDSGIARVELLE